MSIFVSYRDDYDDNGGVGIRAFHTRSEAQDFITQRMRVVENPDITNYQVIEGKVLPIKVVATVAVVKIE